MGDCYLQIADFTKARKYYEKALLINDWNTTIINKLAQLDLKEGFFDACLNRLEHAFDFCKTANDSIQLLSGFQAYYKFKGQPSRSYDYGIEKINLLASFKPPLQMLLTKTFSIEMWTAAGKSDEALAMLKKIESEIQPPFDQITAFGYLFYYVETGQAEKAKDYIPMAHKLIDGFGEKMLLPNVYYAEGKIAEMENDFTTAIEKYLMFRELEPSNTDALRWLARSYRKAGDQKNARKFVEQMIKHKPGSGKNHYEAALFYQSVGDQEKELEFVKKANDIWKDAEEIYTPALKARTLEKELQEFN